MSVDNSSGHWFNQTYSILDDPKVRYPILVMYVLVFLSCVFGNIVVLLVIGLQRSMRTATNFFLANLAIADLFVGLFGILPNGLHVYQRSANWPSGEVICRIYLFVLQLGPCISAALLLLMSIERYIVVLYPISARSLLRPWILGTCTFLAWCVATLSSVPFMVSAHFWDSGDEVGAIRACTRQDNSAMKVLWLLNFIVWYILPVIFLAVMYARIGFVLWHSIDLFNKGAESRVSSKKRNRSRDSTSRSSSTQLQLLGNQVNGQAAPPNQLSIPLNTLHSNGGGSTPSSPLCNKSIKRQRSEDDDTMESRRKVIRLLAVIVVFFAVLTLPHHIRQIQNYYCEQVPIPMDSIEHLAQPTTFLMLFINSACNPFLYAFFSERFRLAFRQLITCQDCRKPVRRRTMDTTLISSMRGKRSDTVTSGIMTPVNDF